MRIIPHSIQVRSQRTSALYLVPAYTCLKSRPPLGRVVRVYRVVVG